MSQRVDVLSVGGGEIVSFRIYRSQAHKSQVTLASVT